LRPQTGKAMHNAMNAKPLPYSNKGDLTTGPVGGHLVRMTIPMLWGMLAVISVQLVDTYFISLMGDTDVLAGISFTFPVTMFISHLVFGINIALSSVVSRLIGAKDMEDSRRVVLHGLLLALGVSSVIALITFLCLKPLFTLLGADETTYPAIEQYMPLWLLASAILALPVNANSAMRAAGDTLVPALVMTAISLINLLIAPVLIFGWFGFPAYGVFGAALSTLLAYIGGAAIALYILIGKRHLIALDGLHLDKFRDSMKRLLVIAIPAGIAQTIMPATSAIIVAIMAGYGSAAVAAYGVVTRIEAFSMLFVIALAIGMAPIIGQNWGAQNYDRVHKTISIAIVFNLIWSALAAVILGVFAVPIASAFSDDPEVIRYASLFFWIVPITYGIGNLVFGWSSAFNAMGKPQKSFVMIFVKAFVLTIPAVYIGSWLYGMMGIFFAAALVNVISGILFHVLSNRYCRDEEIKRLAVSTASI
jgi:putative MATE family efflux protein